MGDSSILEEAFYLVNDADEVLCTFPALPGEPDNPKVTITDSAVTLERSPGAIFTLPELEDMLRECIETHGYMLVQEMREAEHFPDEPEGRDYKATINFGAKQR